MLVVLAGCAPRAGDLSAGMPPGGLDIHLHCQVPTLTCDGGIPCCDLSAWDALTTGESAPAGVLLSLEHFTVIGADAGLPAALPFQNRTVRLHHEQSPNLLWFASLPCWHEQAWGPEWLERCSADVDAQLALGARGFKDHTGKTFMHSAKLGDGLHWLGAWNRSVGTCDVPAGTEAPNAACLTMPSARFPAMEADYRALVKHIVEDRGAVLVTHIRDWGDAPEQCFDAELQSVRRCTDVTRDQVLAFAAWAQANLSVPAARRIVIAHLAFLEHDSASVRALLAAGLSMDTAAMINDLRHCEARALIAEFPGQILWGTDAELGGACLKPTMASWHHLLRGGMEDERKFTGTCAGDVVIKGLALETPKVKMCSEVLPGDAYERVVGGNARALLGL